MRKLVFLSILLLAACDKNYFYGNNPQQPTTPVVENPKVELNSIEFRVLGNSNAAKVRFITPTDGITQVTTVLPYISLFSTDRTTMFLSLEVTPTTYPTSVTNPFLLAQIFVNGNLFREASSADFIGGTISATGTWRK